MAVDPQCNDEPVRNFGTFTDELEAIAQWLHECNVTLVAMESTACTGSHSMRSSTATDSKSTWSTRAPPSRSAVERVTCSIVRVNGLELKSKVS